MTSDIAPPFTDSVLLVIELRLTEKLDTKWIISNDPKWIKKNL
jgi:hypothetical protein